MKNYTFKKMSGYLLFLVLITLLSSCKEEKHIDSYLDKLPQVAVDNHSIEFDFTQPVDHKNPEGEKFTQRVVLNHVGYDHPTVVEFEGYALHSENRIELARLLNANQIIIEHRFFKNSKPDNLDWKYLDIWQSATDHHKIIQAFKKLYPGKWLSTGYSKGGKAVIFHRSIYPDDVHVSVPYVAPLFFTDKDHRVSEYVKQIGTPKEQQDIIAFQRELLKRKEELLPMFQEYAQKKEYHFTMGISKAYNMTVLQYPIMYFQYGHRENSLTPNKTASNEKLLNHLTTVFDGQWFEESGADYFRPFLYQSYTETGMYDYDLNPYKDLLDDTTNLNFKYALPKGMHISFDREAMQKVKQWIKKHGNNMLYIYGEYDPLTAAAVEPGEKTNAVKMVKPGGSHKTSIQEFPFSMRDSIYTVLEKWMDVSINRFEKY